jgi:predicted CoA-binding protein
MEDMKGFFLPRSIAIFGASSDLSSISGKPLRYLQEHGYKGNIYPINPKYQEIGGLKCYPDLLSLPETPDLLLVAVSYKRIFMVLDQCIEKAVKNIIVFSTGLALVSRNISDIFCILFFYGRSDCLATGINQFTHYQHILSSFVLYPLRVNSGINPPPKYKQGNTAFRNLDFLQEFNSSDMYSQN